MIRFISSVSFCTFTNLGVTRSRTIAIQVSMKITATATESDHCHCFPAIFVIAQTAVIGALTIICSPIVISICTCCTSFVVRVIRDAVLNLLISAIEKLCTFR